MRRNKLIKELSLVLCRAACVDGYCLFCENGKCKEEMNKTFLDEAEAIVSFLEKKKFIKS